MTPQDKKEEWREKFDKAVSENYRGQDPYWPDWEGVKNFIFSELALARKEERERIVEMIKGMKKVPYDQHVGNDTGRAYDTGKSSGFNQALDDLLSKLEEEKT